MPSKINALSLRGIPSLPGGESQNLGRRGYQADEQGDKVGNSGYMRDRRYNDIRN